MSTLENRRILLVDDLLSIHDDFRKILTAPADTTDLDAEEAILFGQPTRRVSVRFEMDSAYQGTEALEKVRAARLADRPYAMAFIDMRMPPGWDGLETIEKIWEVDPDVQIVICSAYSDRSFSFRRSAWRISSRLVPSGIFMPSCVASLA